MLASPAARASHARPGMTGGASPAKPVIGVVLKGYPRLSETFIAQELLALEQRGLPLVLYSLRHPTESRRHPIHDAIAAPVHYLPEYLHREPWRVLRAWRRARQLPGYRAARAAFWRDLTRDCSRSRVRRFGQALVLAAEMPPGVIHLHAHFMHTPASVARYASTMRASSWSCSAHAKDIWTTPEWEKREKLAEGAWTVTCTRANADHLRSIGGPAARVELVYHGLDGARFAAPDGTAARPARDGRDPAHPVEILAVGRAVDKKGFDDLLEALARLDAGVAWRFTHIGDGPLAPALARLAQRLGIAARIRWLGPRAHDEVLAAYRDADLFVLPCRISDDGDRDGLPNVLLEAQSQGLACVSTPVSGIPELIEDGVTGVLVTPRDPARLAAMLARLAADPVLRARLGEAGRARVLADFSLDTGADRLAQRLAAALRAR
ncbi:MAG TPA: glycosyltransferase [Casimicrobiaceae bacterium]|nr:glycosyltransferase [Casimicrobiaceae bacterium]